MESSVVAPAIVIAVTDECSEQWRDVLLGIEEEGIPFVLQPQTGGDLIHHAWQAAQRSPLQVGIACDRELHSFPTRRSSDLGRASCRERVYNYLLLKIFF